jgi:alkylation response protein AidB-like acyl-CoA dehydrogenase
MINTDPLSLSMTVPTRTIRAVRDLGGLIEPYVELMDAERVLPDPVVNELIAAKVFKSLVPRTFGGCETDPVTACQMIEELARIDGSTGWVAMLCGSYGLLSGQLPEESAREIFCDPRSIVAGSLRPDGIARTATSGYHVSGRWTMASGINHSTWVLGACRVFDGDMPRLTPRGIPETRVVFVPRSEVEIIDTWHVAGLRGTGSHDYQVHQVFVPADRACRLVDEALQPGPLYKLPYISTATVLMACVALGIARHALDVLEKLTATKVPSRSQNPLREHAHAQAQIGEAEGLVRAGRAFVYQVLDEAWETVREQRRLSWTQHGLLRLAGTQAVAQALQAVDLVFRTGGASSIYTTLPLERCLRDIRTAAQHHCVTANNFEIAGQFFLGYDPATSFWGRDYRSDP